MAALKQIQPLINQRFFAVVHIFGVQRIVTNGDLLMLDNELPLKCGEKLLLNKCLILGCKDFSIIGKPLVEKETFRIEATVVEKTMSDHKCSFRSKPRNHGIRKYFYHANPRTVLRINSIDLKEMPGHELLKFE